MAAHQTLLRQWAMLREVPRAPRRIDTRTLLLRLENQGFEATQRTIQRDLQSLSRVFPLSSDEPHRPAGWWWEGRQVLDIPGMDPGAAVTFALASRFLKPLLPRAGLNHMEPYFLRAREVLKSVHHSGIGKWPDRVRLLSPGQPLHAPKVDREVLDVAYAALLGRKRFLVRYTRRGEKRATEYEVSPLGLVFRDGVIYLVATLWDYADVVQLVLHRMKRAAPLDQDCQPPEGFDLDRYIAQGHFGFKTGQRPVRLRALFSRGAAIHLHETALAPDQRLRERDDGRVLLEARVPATAQLEWWLLGFGADVEVLAPAALRRHFTETAKQLHRTYSGPRTA